MHAFHLAELAGWLAIHEPSMNAHGELPALLADQYWVNSKCRAQRWQTSLRLFQSDIESCNLELNDNLAPAHDPWPALSIVAEEIILSEMLTRVWSAVLAQHELRQEGEASEAGDPAPATARGDLSAIAHGVLIGQIEARNRVCRMLLEAPRWAGQVAERVNALRKTSERWTDLLLSQLGSIEAAKPFAFDEKRVVDFYCERSAVSRDVQNKASQLLLSSLSHDLKAVASRYPANPDTNRKIAYGVLACFANDSLAMCNLPASLWNTRMEAWQANHAQLIEEADQVPVGASQLIRASKAAESSGVEPPGTYEYDLPQEPATPGTASRKKRVYDQRFSSN